MYEDLLTDIGLTRSEIAVYFALLDLGSSTTGPIIKKAEIASGKAYLILDKLVMKGLVTHTIKSGRKYFQAKDPEKLLDYIKEKQDLLKNKEESLKKIIPELKAKFDEQKYKPLSEVYEGVKGFKTFYDWALRELKTGDCIYVMGVPKIANEKFEAYLMEWNKKRIASGIKMKIIYNNDCREFGKAREKMKLTEVRYMKPELETPSWIDIFNEYVVTINTHATPMCFLIRNKESAESYKKYFDIIWEQSTAAEEIKNMDKVSKVTNTQGREKIRISWETYGSLMKILESKTSRLSKLIDNVYGLPRGGLPIAVHFSHYFNKPLITDPNKITKRTLICDDILDSGNSIIKLIGEKNAKKYMTVSLYYRLSSKVKPTEYAAIAKDEWIIFPYEQ
ncbi:MAG: helix-turn-helix domain-containing protein [Nanoarchaeota archaeon]|nr:helix-turn-helix domain-containing protein [Nanoarchaeota archaeon]